MNKKILVLLLIVLVIIGGVVAYMLYLGVTVTPIATIVKSEATGPKDATYTINGQSVTLVNGLSVIPAAPGSASMITTQYFGNEVAHDFDGDGRLDRAFILTQNTGGSGTFYYVVVALNMARGYVGSAGFLLGDRIAPQTTEMSQNPATSDVIVVNYADRKSGEAFTVQPSVAKSTWLKFDVGTMQLNGVANDPNATTIIYSNTDYGFTFSLPANWQGYSIIKGSWEGTMLKNTSAQSGPKLLIRNPKWMTSAPYEDLPILAFTISQWNAYLAGDFSVSAAPIQASEFARNNKYVFALPPRWDFDYSLGYKEAQDIIAGRPLHTFNVGL